MADNLDAFRNGGGQGVDHGSVDGHGDDYGAGNADDREADDHDNDGAEDMPDDHGESECFEDGYETLNNVAGWQIPEGAIRTEALRQVVIRLVARGLDDPDDLATLTLPGLVATIGQLESRLLEQDARIASLEQAMITFLRQITGES